VGRGTGSSVLDGGCGAAEGRPVGGVGGSEGLAEGVPVMARATEVTPNVLSGSSTTCEERSAMSRSEIVLSGGEAKW